MHVGFLDTRLLLLSFVGGCHAHKRTIRNRLFGAFERRFFPGCLGGMRDALRFQVDPALVGDERGVRGLKERWYMSTASSRTFRP